MGHVVPRLAAAAAAVLAQAQAQARRPAFDLGQVEVGVVHFGPGAFFRAHQAPVYHRLLEDGDRRWCVCGVSVRSPGVRDALAPQACGDGSRRSSRGPGVPGGDRAAIRRGYHALEGGDPLDTQSLDRSPAAS